MFNSVESWAIVMATVAAALLFTAGLNRIWSAARRRAHNELIGWQLSTLGTIYAVILGFMLYTVWTDFGVADLNADMEANSLANVYRIAEGLPPGQRTELQALARSYADQVIARDWPQMAANQVPDGSQRTMAAMWSAALSVKGAGSSGSLAQDHVLSELGDLNQHARTRILQSTSRLPTVLWCVLILGAVLTLVSSALLGTLNVALHLLQVFSLAVLISLVLVAIGDLNRPFQGTVHVSHLAFERARESMRISGSQAMPR